MSYLSLSVPTMQYPILYFTLASEGRSDWMLVGPGWRLGLQCTTALLYEVTVNSC